MKIYFILILIAILGTVIALFREDDKFTLICLIADCILALPIIILAIMILTIIFVY